MATTTRKRATTSKPKSDNTATKTTKAPQKVAPKQEEVKPKKKFSDSDGIVCRSITQGGLFMEGAKTRMLYEWVNYGDKTLVEYADLASAVRVKSSFVFTPLFIVEDEDFIEEFDQLKKFYTENHTVQDLESILRLSAEDMMTEISALPKSAVESLKVIAASAITDGTLDSVSKIKVLDELFGTNLGLLAEFKE